MEKKTSYHLLRMRSRIITRDIYYLDATALVWLPQAIRRVLRRSCSLWSKALSGWTVLAAPQCRLRDNYSQSSKCFPSPSQPADLPADSRPGDGMLMPVSGRLPRCSQRSNGLIKKLWAQNQSWYKPGVKLVKRQGKFLHPNAPNLRPFAIRQTDCGCRPPPTVR